MLLFQRIRMRTEHTTEGQPWTMVSCCPSRKRLPHPARRLLKNECLWKEERRGCIFVQFVCFVCFRPATQSVHSAGTSKAGGQRRWSLLQRTCATKSALPSWSRSTQETYVSVILSLFQHNLNCASFFYRCQYL